MGLPLSTLLSQVLVAFTIELDNEFERRFLETGGGARVTSLAIWSNLLRFVGDGSTVGEIAAAAGLPKPKVLSLIGGVERWRYVTVGPTPGEREGYGSASRIKADWVVRLTPAGRRAAEIWQVLPGEIEARWRARFGVAEITELAGTLRPVDARIDAELPEYLPIVSSTGGFSLAIAHGQQRPVGERPLVALLARALMAYTLEFEESSPLPLPLSANVFRVLDDAGVPVRALPALTGISKEAVAVSLTALTKTDYVVVEGARASTRSVRLTPAGAAFRTEERRLHARLGKRWNASSPGLEQLLDRILDDPGLPAGLTPDSGCWRASAAYAERTRALLADPRGQLPHGPIVLPRGGWPDGS